MPLTQRAALRAPFAAIGFGIGSRSRRRRKGLWSSLHPRRATPSQCPPLRHTPPVPPPTAAQRSRRAPRRGSGHRPSSTRRCSRGRAFHCMPVRNTYKMAPSISRSLRGGRPPLGCGLGAGNNGSARAHNASLSSHGCVRFSFILPALPRRSSGSCCRAVVLSCCRAVVLSCCRAGARRPKPPLRVVAALGEDPF